VSVTIAAGQVSAGLHFEVRERTGTGHRSHPKWVFGEDAPSLSFVPTLKQRRKDGSRFGRGIWIWGISLASKDRGSIALEPPRTFPQARHDPAGKNRACLSGMVK
jgi:hypothetical protein